MQWTTAPLVSAAYWNTQRSRWYISTNTENQSPNTFSFPITDTYRRDTWDIMSDRTTSRHFITLVSHTSKVLLRRLIPLPVMIEPTVHDMTALQNAVLCRVHTKPAMYLVYPLYVLKTMPAGVPAVDIKSDNAHFRGNNVYWPQGIKLTAHRRSQIRVSAESANTLYIVVDGMLWNPNSICTGCQRELDRATEHTCFPLAFNCLRADQLPVPEPDIYNKMLVYPDPEHFIPISVVFPVKPFKSTRHAIVPEVSPVPDEKKVTGCNSPAYRAAVTRKIRNQMCPHCIVHRKKMWHNDDCPYAYAAGYWQSRAPDEKHLAVPSCHGPFRESDIFYALNREPEASMPVPPWIAHVHTMHYNDTAATGLFSSRSLARPVMPMLTFKNKPGRYVLVYKDITRGLTTRCIPYEDFCQAAKIPVCDTPEDLTRYDSRAIRWYQHIHIPENLFPRVLVNQAAVYWGHEMEECMNKHYQYGRIVIKVFPVLPTINTGFTPAIFPYGGLYYQRATVASRATYDTYIRTPDDHLPWSNPSKPDDIQYKLFRSLGTPISKTLNVQETVLTPERMNLNVAFINQLVRGTARKRVDYITFEREYGNHSGGGDA